MSAIPQVPEAAPDALPLVLLEAHDGGLDPLRRTLESFADLHLEISQHALHGWAPGFDDRGLRGILVQGDSLAERELGARIAALRQASAAAIVLVDECQDLSRLRTVLDAGGDGLIALQDSPSTVVGGIVGAIHARHRARKLELELECAVHMTNHDRITNLENRYSLERRLTPLLATAARKQRKLGVLLVSTRGLDSVNDSFGQQAGNQMLRDLADRLIASVRRSDEVSLSTDEAAETAVSHLGGSDFTVLLSEIADAQDAARVAQRILDSLSEAFWIEDQEVFVRTNVGIAVFPFDGANADALLRNARSARRRAESSGGNAFRFYAKSMNNEAARRLKLSSLLHRALERNEFSIHYQPLREANSGRLIGMEALLRWSTQDMGEISPSEFVPIAEDNNLIVPIGEWVLRTASQQYRRWLDEGYRATRLAVNLSGRQLQGGELVEAVSRILSETGMSSSDLELEITETTIAREDRDARATLEELRDMGIGLALDDFGTGFSTLTHLSNFPVDRLKIDRSFISEIGRESAGSNLASALIAMAHSLDLGVVAEGVETEEQARFLRAHGCDELQGFLLGRPVPAPEFEAFLDRNKRTN